MSKKFLRILILFAICHLLFALGYFSGYADTLDKIIVVVNGETITQAELDAAVESATQKVKSESTPEEFNKRLEAYRKDILNRMIEEKLILSAAKKQDIKAEDAEIEERLKEVKARFGSEERFNETLKEQDVSLKELKQKYADQIIIAELMNMEVRKKIVITPSEILQYYETHKEEFKAPEGIRLKNILIKPQDASSDEEARNLAEKIRGFLKAGESFDELALKYSKGPNADKGGDLGFVSKGQMMKEIEDAVFNLNPGEISEVIKTSLGYHIFKVEEKRSEQVKELNEVKDEIEKAIYYEKGKALYTKWIEDLKKNAYISYR